MLEPCYIESVVRNYREIESRRQLGPVHLELSVSINRNFTGKTPLLKKRIAIRSST